MKLESFWLDTAPPFTGASLEAPEGLTDVAIVGGGFTGLSAALTLARRGVSVRVLEAGRVASEASGRNGGHCNNGLSHDFSGVASRVGMDRAREMYRAFDSGVDLVEAIVKREGIDCDFTRSGKLKVAAKPEHFEKLARAQDVLAREVDADTKIIPRADLGAEVATGRYFGGLLYRRSASMHMGKFGAGLASAGARAGATIHQNAAVTAIERVRGGRFRIKTIAGVSEAGAVLLATRASQSGPFGWFCRRIVPGGSFIIVTEPLGGTPARAVLA